MSRPVIGLTAYIEQARWGSHDRLVALLPHAYVEAVDRAGGRPVLLPPMTGSAKETLAAVDALVLTGGPDLDPALYGAAAHPRTAGVRPERDRGEVELAVAAVDRGMPTLAVCRGMQLLTVVAGGSLIQHLPDEVGHEEHRPAQGGWAEHEVTIAGDSLLGRLLGTQATVHSSHHQGIARLGSGLRPTAWAPDGTVEALEVADAPILGVLWHPEVGEDLRLFTWLVDAAGR